jgi:glycosyltransferase involved in cell wall biosynthesis
MKESPLISVVIPVYNVEKYLKECVASVLNQHFKDFEIILVDDGSTDNCEAICDTFSEKDLRVNVIHKKNEGVGLARNTGLKVATGKYIFFLDSDDFVEPNFFVELISETNRNFDIIQFGFNRISKRGKYVNTSIPASAEIKSLPTEKEKLALILDSGCGLSVWDKLIKREFLLEQEIFFDNKKRGEDFTFIIKLYHHTKTIMVINKALINYRIIMGTGKKFDPKLIQNHLDNFSSLKNLLDDKSLNSKKYLRKIFSIWFFKVIPINIAANGALLLKEKIRSLEILRLDSNFSSFLNNMSNSALSLFEKLMVFLFLNKKYRSIITVGKTLTFIRKIMYK